MQIKIEGKIDEACEFPSLDSPEDRILEINMNGVTMINSMGVRSWMNWAKGFAHFDKVSLHEVPQVVVEQVNMIHAFLPENVQVDSFYIPFYSEETDEEVNFLAHRSEHYQNGEVQLPDVKDSEGNDMMPDVFKERYFGFLKK